MIRRTAGPGWCRRTSIGSGSASDRTCVALTAIERARGGYQLRVSWDLLDTERFERRIAEGHQARRAGDEQLARRLLASGLSYWRGVPFGSLPGPALAVRREYLTEYRLVALEDRIELDLRYGDPAAIVPEIRLLRAGYPARERFTAHLMYALWRCGRQAEAVDAYGETRRRLVRDLGVEPGTALRDLYCKILRATRGGTRRSDRASGGWGRRFRRQRPIRWRSAACRRR
nr:AfsR/SARP family transcriptional regulator [Fodinicola feengrottensis]